MAFGKLNGTQKQAMQSVVRGRVVHDLGAGDLTLSRKLLGMGAKRVVAHDCCFDLDRKMTQLQGVRWGWTRQVCQRVGPTPKLELNPNCFWDYKGRRPSLAFVSWPVNYDGIGLVELLQRVPTVIYLGTNVGGTSCGGTDLWEHLVTRQVLAYVPDRKNTLIIYGNKVQSRPPYGEERAAIQNERIWTFEEAEGLSKPTLNGYGASVRLDPFFRGI